LKLSFLSNENLLPGLLKAYSLQYPIHVTGIEALLYSFLLNHSLDLFLQANMDSLNLCSGGCLVDEEGAR
jgi:hypothetical protein